jgi:hypothetical protein
VAWVFFWIAASGDYQQQACRLQKFGNFTERLSAQVWRERLERVGFEYEIEFCAPRFGRG